MTTGRAEPTQTKSKSLQLYRDREQSLLILLQKISLVVARSDSTDQAFRDVLAHICRFMDWPLGHVYIWSEAVDALVSSRIWYMVDNAAIDSLRAVSENTQFQLGEGSIGRVWQSGKPVFILDVRQETMFVRKQPVLECGILAYFAFPVILKDEVTAVLEFFSPKAIPLDHDMTTIINHVSTLLGLAMQRQQTLFYLQQSKAQLDEAQRTAHVGHWEWDVLKNEVIWSPELYRIYDLSPDTFTATYEGFIDRVHPDDVDYVSRKVDQAYHHGTAFDYFHRIIRSDGSIRVLHSRGRPLYDEVGKIIKLHGTAQDMTEQKEAELELAQKVRQLSALMEIGQAVSAMLDLEAIYERVLTLVRPLIGAETFLLFLHKAEMLEVAAVDPQSSSNASSLTIPAQEGIAGKVWQSGQSILLQGEECVQQLSSPLMQHIGYQPQAVLAVPLRWRDEAVGVLKAAHHDANAFKEDDLPLLEMAAAWTAIAIGNVRQHNQLQRRLHESDAMLVISNALTKTLDLDELLQLIANKAQKIIIHAEWTTIHLLRPKTKQLTLAASAGLEIQPEAYVINPGEGIAGRVIEEGGVINAADMQTDPRRLPFDVSVKAHSLLAAPVESRQQRIGTISVQCSTPRQFTAEDERLLTILGVQAGMAIENARMHALQRRARQRAETQRERMRRMAQRVVEAQEMERARIARELHDESGQSLTSLKISLDLIRSMLPDELADIKDSLWDVLELTDKTMSNLRLLSHNLRPPGLDAYGLNAALAGLCQDVETHTHLSVNYTGTDLPGLAAMSALSLYRFAQEALTNATKHAEATQAQVSLAQESDVITLTITDNGRGFVPPNLEEAIPVHGAGLVGMVERIEMVDGHLNISATPEKGSCLTAVVPYHKEKT